jgi:hypothetical protein
MLKKIILGFFIVSIATSCSLETKSEDSNRYEVVSSSQYFIILLDKQTGESWTANFDGSASENTLKANWIKNTKY